MARRIWTERGGWLGLLLAVALTVGARGGEARTTADTAADLQRMINSKQLSFEQVRALNETLELLKAAQRSADRTQQKSEAEQTLRRLLLEQADAEQGNRTAAINAARFLLYLGEADAALRYILRARPASADDVEWPLLCTRAYLQLGDFEKAALASARADGLLQGRSQLQLSKPVAVDQVTGYRLYAPAQNKRPAAGDMLTLYVEISGAKFLPVSDGSRCCLDFALELRDELQNVQDSSENYGRYDPVFAGPVRDLNATIYYRLPEKLTPGKYVLIIRCTDTLSGNAVASTEYGFALVSAGRPEVPAKVEAKREAIMQQALSGNMDRLNKEYLSDDPLEDLEKKAKELEGTGQTEAQKMGLKMKMEQSKRTGGALEK